MDKKKITFTALEMSSVNGGMIPDITDVNEMPNTMKLPIAMNFFAPKKDK